MKESKNLLNQSIMFDTFGNYFNAGRKPANLFKYIKK